MLSQISIGKVALICPAFRILTTVRNRCGNHLEKSRPVQCKHLSVIMWFDSKLMDPFFLRSFGKIVSDSYWRSFNCSLPLMRYLVWMAPAALAEFTDASGQHFEKLSSPFAMYECLNSSSCKSLKDTQNKKTCKKQPILFVCVNKLRWMVCLTNVTWLSCVSTSLHIQCARFAKI